MDIHTRDLTFSIVYIHTRNYDIFSPQQNEKDRDKEKQQKKQ